MKRLKDSSESESKKYIFTFDVNQIKSIALKREEFRYFQSYILYLGLGEILKLLLHINHI